MTDGVLVAMALLAGAGTCAFLTGYVTVKMHVEVNRKLPEGQQISYVGWHYWKLRRVLREYGRLYPNGRLVSAFTTLTGVTVVLLVATMFAFVFTSPAFR